VARGRAVVGDVEQFERALAEGRFEEAVETYAGELLDGRYDEWLVDERERLAGLYLEALERLARRHGHNGRWPEAIRCAERLVAHDPLREESHRLLMELFRASGDRARAVRAYHACAATLERTLGIEPSPETRALYESLVAAPAGTPEAAPASSAATPGTSPFVGRAEEQAQLAAVWRAAAAGRAHLVLVSGEAGVGKTRLVDELRASAPRSALGADPSVRARFIGATAPNHTRSVDHGGLRPIPDAGMHVSERAADDPAPGRGATDLEAPGRRRHDDDMLSVADAARVARRSVRTLRRAYSRAS
jgi:Bacterial transcriptional activator domain/AAA ATPase domain